MFCAGLNRFRTDCSHECLCASLTGRLLLRAGQIASPLKLELRAWINQEFSDSQAILSPDLNLPKQLTPSREAPQMQPILEALLGSWKAL